MNATIEAVDAFKPYDDADLQSKVTTLSVETKALKERLLSTMEASVRVSEKASDAIAMSRETKAMSDAGGREAVARINAIERETQARLAGIEQELKTTAAQLRSEMNALKRATTNPLGR